MHELYGERRVRVKDLPRVERDGSVHALLFCLRDQGLETLCGIANFESDTLPSSNAITCVSCLALHDEDLAFIEVMRVYNDHSALCVTLARMHEAATGVRGSGPVRGLVEDIEDLKEDRDTLYERCGLQNQEIIRLKRQIDDLKTENGFLRMKALSA